MKTTYGVGSQATRAGGSVVCVRGQRAGAWPPSPARRPHLGSRARIGLIAVLLTAASVVALVLRAAGWL